MRLPPLPEELWDEPVRDCLKALLPEERRNQKAAGNALSVLVRHPDLTRSFLPFNTRLLVRSTLPPRVRELAILRVASRCDCAYEWVEHVKIAAREGLSESEIEAAGRGEGSDEFEHAVVRAVDELQEGCNLTDETWALLSDRLDERQLMDLIFTIGAYGMVAMAFNTFGVEPDTAPLHP